MKPGATSSTPPGRRSSTRTRSTRRWRRATWPARRSTSSARSPATGAIRCCATNVVITPHIGGATHETLPRAARWSSPRSCGSPPASRSSTSSTGPSGRSPARSAPDAACSWRSTSGPAAAARCSSTPEGARSAIGQREWTHPALPGVPRLAGLRHARNWQLICACIREALESGGRAPTASPRSAHEHARGHGAVRRGRARDLGLPERRLARRRRGGRARPERAPRRRSSSRPATGSRSRPRPASCWIARARARGVRRRSPTSGCSATGSSTG